MWNAEGLWHRAKGIAHSVKVDVKVHECGLRPLRAVGSIYEPEAVGAIGA